MVDASKTNASDDVEVGIRPPPRRLIGLLASIGPGIVVIGSVMGSGELINTPKQAAEFGFVLLWAVILSCVIKYFLQIEIGRHALAHNRTPLESLNSLPFPKFRGTSWIGLLFVATSIPTSLALAGMLGATAGLLHALL
ncbi:MAG: Nramp family divalent metal transporter, partial [Pirellulaceae bacterium]